jgi:4-hydroxy-2-oxoglutarate aldolase
MKPPVCGIYAPLTTPFLPDGAVDEDGLRKNMAFYAASGLHGFLALGSNGENKSLSQDEKLLLLRIIIEGKNPEQKVMAGVISESTRESLGFIRLITPLGPDYLTLMAPSYFAKQMTEEALYRYFCTLADAADIPCLVYNAPQFSGGLTLSAPLMTRLGAHPNIVGLKDSSNAAGITAFLFGVRDSLSVLAGSADFFLTAMTMGASGGVLSLANIFPALTVELYDLALAKKYEAAFVLNEQILRLNKGISGRGGVAAVKRAMDLAGLTGGDPRLPLLPLNAEETAALKGFLQKEKEAFSKN